MLWILIFLGEMMATGGTAFNTTGFTYLDALMSPNFTNVASVVSAFWSLITGVAFLLKELVQILFLWSPEVWTGNYIYVWFIICLPLGLSIVLGLVFIMRGVGNK
jgi:hypothetical protein